MADTPHVPVVLPHETGIDYDHLAKLMAILVATIYAIGIVVVNLHLAKFGVSGMGLLREQYVYAGALALLPVLTISITVAMFCGFVFDLYRGDIALATIRGKAEHTKWDRAWTAISAAGKATQATSMAIAIAGFAFTWAINRALPGVTALVTTRDVLIMAGQIALFAIGIGGLCAGAVALFRTTGNQWN